MAEIMNVNQFFPSLILLVGILAVFAFFILSIFIRTRRGQKTPLGMVVVWLAEIRLL